MKLQGFSDSGPGQESEGPSFLRLKTDVKIFIEKILFSSSISSYRFSSYHDYIRMYIF